MTLSVALGVVVVALVLLELVQRRGMRHVRTRRDEVQRRVGWRFGYGAGWVDHENGVYQPEPPPGGRARPKWPPNPSQRSVAG